VRLDESLLRPAEVDHLIGDASKARAALGWKPSVTFAELVRTMVDADLQRLGRPTPVAHGSGAIKAAGG
jgi:GDPmannose 4,6-dehydratase